MGKILFQKKYPIKIEIEIYNFNRIIDSISKYTDKLALFVVNDGFDGIGAKLQSFIFEWDNLTFWADIHKSYDFTGLVGVFKIKELLKHIKGNTMQFESDVAEKHRIFGKVSINDNGLHADFGEHGKKIISLEKHIIEKIKPLINNEYAIPEINFYPTCPYYFEIYIQDIKYKVFCNKK